MKICAASKPLKKNPASQQYIKGYELMFLRSITYRRVIRAQHPNPKGCPRLMAYMH